MAPRKDNRIELAIGTILIVAVLSVTGLLSIDYVRETGIFKKTAYNEEKKK
jgi:hypothetical protein